jgi:NDP-sugar pyrophosphorylase family protein
VSSGDVTALVLAGGLGTRLRSVASDLPKAMVQVAGRPFLEWLILQGKAHGIDRFVFCTGHRSEIIESYFGDGKKWGVHVLYSREPVPMGTGGALRLALNVTGSSLLLALNGDSYCCYNPTKLLHVLHRNKAGAVLWLVRLEAGSRYGSVRIGPEGVVAEFTEKDESGSSGLISAGVYLMQREFIEAIPAGAAVSLERAVLPGCIGKGLYGLVDDGPFIDIGTPESFARAQDFMRMQGIHLHDKESPGGPDE